MPKLKYTIASLLLVLSLGACVGATPEPSPDGTPSPLPADTISPTAEAQTTSTQITGSLATATASEMSALVNSSNRFAFALNTEISSGADNLCFSPYGITQMLAMAYAGAQGATAMQIAKTAGFTLPPDRLAAAFTRLRSELSSAAGSPTATSPSAAHVDMRSTLWAQADFGFTPGFLDTLTRGLGADLQLVDFTKDPEQVRKTINAWAAGGSGGTIEEMLEQGSVDAPTRMVLTTLASLNVPWQVPFEAGETTPSEFYLLDGSHMEVPMMHLEARLPTARGQNFQALELPYAGGSLSMLVIVPDRDHFAEVGNRLSPQLVADTLNALQPENIDLAFPKFAFDDVISLPAALQRLGIDDAFRATQADFSGMDGKRDLYISAMAHKASIQLDEQGSGVHAVTAVSLERSLRSSANLRVTVERPFFFFVRDSRSGALLFMGRLTQPGTLSVH